MKRLAMALENNLSEEVKDASITHHGRRPVLNSQVGPRNNGPVLPCHVLDSDELHVMPQVLIEDWIHDSSSTPRGWSFPPASTSIFITAPALLTCNMSTDGGQSDRKAIDISSTPRLRARHSRSAGPTRVSDNGPPATQARPSSHRTPASAGRARLKGYRDSPRDS
jgi:hypothetical protein